MTISADPDQLAPEANWSGSTLFAKTKHVVFSKRRVNCAHEYNIVYKAAELSVNLLPKRTGVNMPGTVLDIAYT